MGLLSKGSKIAQKQICFHIYLKTVGHFSLVPVVPSKLDLANWRTVGKLLEQARPEKNSNPSRYQSHDLCTTSPVQLDCSLRKGVGSGKRY